MNATCRGTHEPVEMLLRCNGEREPSWFTGGHSCGPLAARRNSAHWWRNRQNRGWRRPDYPSRMRLRTCGTLRPSSSGLAPVGLKQSPLRRFCEDGFLGFRVKTANFAQIGTKSAQSSRPGFLLISAHQRVHPCRHGRFTTPCARTAAAVCRACCSVRIRMADHRLHRCPRAPASSESRPAALCYPFQKVRSGLTA